MKLFPAIDLIGGKAVRLLRGDYEKMTVYSDDPVSVARSFRDTGARFIHLVDLEGARDGEPKNFDTVLEIISIPGLNAEVGGGIRSVETVEQYLSAGVNQVILGTAALEDESLLCSLVSEYYGRITVGVDIRNGFVAVKGWTETSTISALDFMTKLSEIGVHSVICTDISKDGAMGGTNRELYREFCSKFNMNITASGGISTLDDIRTLNGMGLYGAILGRALYTKDINLHAAIEIAGNQE